MQRFFDLTHKHQHLYTVVKASFCLITLALLSGCGIFGPAAAVSTATPTRAYAPVPTFTATPQGAPAIPTPAPTIAPTTVPTVAIAVAPVTKVLTSTVVVTATTIPTTAQVTTPANTAASEPRLTITGDAVNVRSGPGTTFTSIGAATKGSSFLLRARNAAGDWWQICCVNEQPGWIFGELATVENAESVAIAVDPPTPVQPTAAAVAEAPIPEQVTAAPPTNAPAAPAPPPASSDPSAGDFNPDAQYQIVHFKVLGLDENNGGIRDSRAQHHIFLTVLDQSGNGVNGAVVENLVGEKGQVVTGDKGPGKAEITMYYEPFKLRVASDGSGPVTSQTSNQMGLTFPHLPDIVGKLGGVDYEYGVCPTIDIKCQWPIQAVHFSYEITFQKVK